MRAWPSCSSLPFRCICVDYLARFILADHRARWFFRNLPDLVIIALPFLRSLRVLRLVVLVEVMERLFGDAFRGRIVFYTVYSALLLIYAASLGVLDAERQLPQADIKNFGDAVWWAFTTITTVGYGDYHPITVTGRVIAVLLMVGGVSLIGIITATVVTWIVQRVADIDAAEQAATAGQIEELRSEIAHLKEMVSEIHGNGRGETASGKRKALDPTCDESSGLVGHPGLHVRGVCGSVPAFGANWIVGNAHVDGLGAV